MSNIITIHDDNNDVDTHINLDDNHVIQMLCAFGCLETVISEEILEQFMDSPDCYIYHLMPDTILNGRTKNCCRISNDVDWAKDLRVKAKEYRNIVLMIDHAASHFNYYISGFHNYGHYDSNMRNLMLSEDKPNFTFFYFSRRPALRYPVSKTYFYGVYCLIGIKYSENPILLQNFLNGNNYKKKRIAEQNEKLALKQNARYFLACMEVYRQLRIREPMRLIEEPESILRNRKYCHSDVDHISNKLYHLYSNMMYDDDAKVYYCPNIGRLKIAMKELLSFTAYSEVGKALILNEKDARKLLSQNNRFDEWELFEYELFWEKVEFKTIIALL